MSNNKSWQFTVQRKITGYLTTTANLHVGSGETDTHPDLTKEKENKTEPVQINSVAKDGDNKPFIPGSTLKGNLLSWLKNRVKTDARPILHNVFGTGTESARVGQSTTEKGCGGKADFWDISLETPIEDESPLPYWDQDRQVFVETSVAIDRVTRTAIDQKLIHKEMVPKGVKFLLTICGPLDEPETALLLAALNGFNDTVNPVTLGSGTASGCGKMSWQLENVEQFGAKEAEKWFVTRPQPMLYDSMTHISSKVCSELELKGSSYLQNNCSDIDLELSLFFDGPFLIDDPPTKKEKKIKEEAGEDSDRSNIPPDHKVLRDADGKPRLPEKSIRGGLRAQAERILRTFEIDCCSPSSPCSAVYSVASVRGSLCPVCKLFGAPGWKSPLMITDFTHSDGKPDSIRQDFVAIDRFTGGGKPGAKFDADYIFSPTFKGHLKLDTERLDKAEFTTESKGLLALVLRDLCEGDITLGFGRAKGYGTFRASVPDAENVLSEADVKAFLEKAGIAVDSSTENFEVSKEEKIETNETPSPQPLYQRHTFHNPYHFVSVTNPDIKKWQTKEIWKTSETAAIHTHDRYFDREKGEKVYNGRLLCRLETKTPIFIGGKQKPQTIPKEVEPFKLEPDDECAIPATTLRGMLSSITEAASGSSLRVLEDKPMSRRAAMGESLPAMGMLVKEDDKLQLLPLALPAFKCRADGSLQQPVPKKWKTIFNVPCLKVYLDEYKTVNGELCYSSRHFKNRNSQPVSCSSDKLEFWYMKLGSNSWQKTGKNYLLKVDEPRTKKNGKFTYLLGQKAKTPSRILSQKEYDDLDGGQQYYEKGILRVLGIDGREKDMPGNRRHEIFLPFPKGFGKNTKLDVTDALATFHKLADERAKAEKDKKYPFEVKGKQRTIKDGVSSLRLKNRDIVFFDIDENGEVTDLAVSSIWRKEINGSVFDYFSELGDNASELVPFNPKRKYISPAELLFGFVEDRKKRKEEGESEQDQPPALAFAGKVRVSFGRLAADQSDVFEEPVTLKALSTPKLPSPALYFKNKAAGYISKSELSLRGNSQMKAIPQGYKRYLHCYMQNGEIVKLNHKGYPLNSQDRLALNPWESKSNHLSAQEEDVRAKLKVRVTPVKSGTTFYFHIDFDNLSQDELNLLCYSIRPDEHFQHKLGMGKPIGLGSVSVDPIGLYLLNRTGRYQKFKDVPRYNGGVWQSENMSEKEYPLLYKDEKALARSSATAPNPLVLAAEYAKNMNQDVKQGLSLLGNPNHVTAPVHYPQVKDTDIEDENFKWFVANDIGTNNGRRGDERISRRKCEKNLLPLDKNSNNIPGLQRYEWLGR